ncbi:hypothetical protein [Streptomyces sp. NPDC057909]|uniref:hypothetical protein n=1 Tax=Streptomyces sp. NPDC057909 TaxID=3346277 RepID=UPI0036E9677D
MKKVNPRPKTKPKMAGGNYPEGSRKGKFENIRPGALISNSRLGITGGREFSGDRQVVNHRAFNTRLAIRVVVADIHPR